MRRRGRGRHDLLDCQAFDRAGNVTADSWALTGMFGDAGSVTTTFTYDRTDQAASQVIGGTTRTFDHDRFANLVQSADAASAVTTYSYDEASRLTAINPPGGAGSAITFGLDALDRHTTRSVGGATADSYAYLAGSEVATAAGSGGSASTSLLDADGSRLAVRTGSAVAWLVFDLHGSVAGLCPAGTTSLSDAYRYSGWGEQVASAGSAVNPWRYRGLLNIGSDALAGALLDMASRDYSPQLGTFTSQDSYAGSAADPASLNRFLYALANPATLVDPDGHMALETTSGTGAPIYPTPTITPHGAEDTSISYSCSTCVRVPTSVAPTDLEPFSGYAPEAVEASESWRAITSELDAACLMHDEAACDAIWQLYDWKGRNDQLYCFTHRAYCDGRLSRELHDKLGFMGLIPVFGIAFDGADALLYAAEGDYLGATMSIGFAVPGLGDAGRGGKYALEGLEMAPELRAGLRFGDDIPTPGSFCSFTPDTTVLTPDGEIPIGQLQVGDLVLARDETTGVTAVREITAVLVHADAVTGTVVIDGEAVETTPEHPFFSLDRGFIPAADLRPGELVASASGDPGIVDSVTWNGGPAVMWNLTVAADHTFFVGTGGWWVHNHCGSPHNPWGSMGSPDHRAVMDQAAADIGARGLVAGREVTIGNRRADVVAYHPSDLSRLNPLEIHQVGVQTKGGLPVPRERYAFDDLIRSLPGSTTFVFWPYKVRT